MNVSSVLRGESILKARTATAFNLMILVCFFGMSFNLEAVSQTAAELEAIIKNSNGIDATRPLRAYMQNGVATVSTFAPPKASDQDCKINSLFITKALMERYKNIKGLRITFYDTKLASGFRTIEVPKELARRVDAGRPVQEVLAQVKLVHGQRPAQIIAKSKAPSKRVNPAELIPQQLLKPKPLTAAQRQQQETFNETLENINSISNRLLGK